MLSKIFKDRQGHIVVLQKPNVLLWAWIVSTLLSKVINTGDAHTFVTWIGFFALVGWSCLEIVEGKSIFRRLLGMIILFLTVHNRF